MQAGLSGRAAIKALGSHIDEVAERYALTANELRARILADLTLRINARGDLYAMGLGQFASLPRWSGPIAADGGIPGPANKLHSNPGAPRHIYLNFAGQTITDTLWNDAAHPTLVAPAFQLPGPGETDAMIKAVWQRVAEDFAPFNVDVTTDPDAADLRAYTGVTVIITPGISGFCRCSTATYFDQFQSGEPILIFTDSLNRAREKSIAEATSQSLGRMFGLAADGAVTATRRPVTTPRYGGAGLGKTGWAPIMGDSTYKELTQFSRGDYPGANNKEDDFTRLQASLDLRGDDAGNDVAQAYSLDSTVTADRAQSAFGGVLGISGDADVFAVYAGRGPLNVTVAPRYRGGNTDLKLTLLTRSGAVLQTSDPASDTSASISANLTAGTYFIKVEGGTSANPYGNVGTYRLTADYAPNVATAPVASIQSSAIVGVAPFDVVLDGQRSQDDVNITSYRWSITNPEPSYFTSSANSERQGATQSVSFVSPGTYTVQLAVTDSEGHGGFTSQQIQVLPGEEPPEETEATFDYQGSSSTLVYYFKANSALKNWGVGTYFWNFGSGWVAAGANPIVQHTFPAPGTYTVQLGVRSKDGEKFAQAEQQVVIGSSRTTPLASR